VCIIGKLIVASFLVAAEDFNEIVRQQRQQQNLVMT
jgi:hypothetical protein